MPIGYAELKVCVIRGCIFCSQRTARNMLSHVVCVVVKYRRFLPKFNALKVFKDLKARWGKQHCGNFSLQTPAGSHIYSSGSCGGKALAEFLPRQQCNVPETENSAKQVQGFCNVEVREHLQSNKTVTARTNTTFTPQGQIKNLPLSIFHN